MEPDDAGRQPDKTDWNSWGMTDHGDVDSMVDVYQKDEAGSVMSEDGGKSETMYDNMGADDLNLQFYDGYDSYNEVSESMSEDEEDSQQENYPFPNTVQQSPYRFMNGKDGMATCERCGAVGIKHAFYSKSKRFCSLSCSRSFATSQREGKPLDLKDLKETKAPKKQIAMKRQKSGKLRHARRNHTKSPNSKQGIVQSFDWGAYLISSNADGAPVSCFKHVPMSDNWENISVGMKVEVHNQDCDLPNQVFWIATVMKIAGYKALMRYEGFGEDHSKDFWINLCNKDIHPVGWCATSGKPLVPPKTIQHKYVDWKDYLVKRLTGARTLPSNFYTKVHESINNHRLVQGMNVEVVDKMCVSAMRVATVDEIIGGRLRLHYNDSKEEGDEFWCHMKSALLHPVGWSQQVGHKLHATQEYRNQCLGKITMQKYSNTDATPDMFPPLKPVPEGFKVGMKLEAIDPLNLSAICVATVMKVLKNNYLMIGIDGSIAQNGTDWFCYHASSPCIFPVGFCEVNGLNLTPPRGYKGPFKWFDYLKATRSVAAPVKLFDKEISKHGFKAGMKLEAVDLMEPRLICVGTVTRVVGRLLRVHFDGWETDYDQWVDCESPDMYPVGWCEIMNYHVEGPRIKSEVIPAAPPQPKKRKGKSQIYKGPRKKRKPKVPLSPTLKSMSTSQFDMMRHRLLNTRLEAGERPQEVPQFSSSPQVPQDSNQPSSVGGFVKQEPMEAANSGPPKLIPNNSWTCLSQQLLKTESKSPVVSLAQQKPANTTKSALLERITANPLNTTTGVLSSHLTQASSAVKSQSGLVPSHGGQTGTVVSSAGNQAVSVPETQTLYLTQRQQTLSPEVWSTLDVCHFLKYNDCAAYVETFHKKGIDGKTFVALTKEQIVSLTGMKVGSSLKIHELIQVLKSKMASQSTTQTTLMAS